MFIKKALYLFVFSLFVLLLSLFTTQKAYADTTVTITSPSAGQTIQSSSFTVAGTATAKRNIVVKIDGQTVGTTTSNDSGNWSVNVTGQSSGSKSIEVTASTDLLYANVINPSDISSSAMNIFNTLDDSSVGSFSIISGGIPFAEWLPNSTFTKAFGAATILSSPNVFTIDLTGETVGNFTMAGTTPQPSGIAYSQDYSKVYITDSVNDVVRVYNTTTNAEIGSGITVGAAPIPIVARPGTNEVWVLNSEAGDSLSVIDTDTDTVIHTYSTVSDAANIVFSPDGTRLYLTTDTDGDVVVINPDTGSTITTISGPGASSGGSDLVVNSTNTRLYTVGISSNFVRVFDLQNQVLLTSIPTTTGPLGLALTSDGSGLYVSQPNLIGGANGTTISRISTSTNEVERSFTTSGAPMYLFNKLDSAIANAEFTVLIDSSSSNLASTGSNRLAIEIMAALLMFSGIVTTTYELYKYKKQ